MMPPRATLKTTAAKANHAGGRLHAQVRPRWGRVRIDGQGLGALDEDLLAPLRGRRMGILFQAFHLIPTMTVLEDVALPLERAVRPVSGAEVA
jgi:predicted ABC-type transport system involved in lysophospholipase L1 biosynthesis ATPase subunit